jgi:hypothetical protein
MVLLRVANSVDLMADRRAGMKVAWKAAMKAASMADCLVC